MHVELSGDPRARPVLLLHGGGVGGWMWGPVLAQLGDSARAIVPDLPGHDRSAAESYRGHSATVDELIALLDEVDAREGLTVVGFSLGAQLATLLTTVLAAREPERVAHAVIVSAQAHPMPGRRSTLALLRALAPLARNERFARAQARELRVPAELMSDYLRTSASMSTQNLLAAVDANLTFTVPAGWAESRSRVDILVGEKERRVMHRSAAALHAARPDASILVIPGIGHSAPFERPDLIADIIRSR